MKVQGNSKDEMYILRLVKMIDDYGNDFNSSLQISIDENISGNFTDYDDVDFFKFTTTKAGVYGIYSGSYSFPFTISLYDENHVNIPLIGSFATLDSNKTYYIKISNVGPIENLYFYDFLIKGPIIDDYGSSFNSAKEIHTDEKIEGMINYYSDYDYFKFVPLYDGKYVLKELSFSVRPGDFSQNPKVYDENGNPLYDLYAQNPNEFTLSKGKEYYIEFSSEGFLNTPEYSYSFKMEGPIADDSGSINGYISPDSFNSACGTVKSGFSVVINNTTLSTVTDENGHFQITKIPKSSSGYEITISKDGYLKRTLKNVVVNGDVTLSQKESPIDVWAGDLDKPYDNSINMSDVILIAKAFGTAKQDSSFINDADFNGDSIINFVDVILLARHFNMTSDDYPQIGIN